MIQHINRSVIIYASRSRTPSSPLVPSLPSPPLPSTGPGLISQGPLPGDERQEFRQRGEGFPHHGLGDPQACGQRGRGDAERVERDQGPECQDQQRPAVAGRGQTDTGG